MTSIISGITNTKSAAMPIAAFKASGIQATTASQAGALAATKKSAPVIQALPAFKVSSSAAAAISGLSAASLTNSQQTSLTAKQINAMSKSQVQSLNVADIPVNQIAGLTSGLTNMSGAQIGALSTPQSRPSPVSRSPRSAPRSSHHCPTISLRRFRTPPIPA